LPNLNSISIEFPNYIPYHEEEEAILRDEKINEVDKDLLVDKIRNEYYTTLNEWKLTIKKNQIDSIRLSVFVSLIKYIIGVNCFINFLDYSCNSISKYVSKIATIKYAIF
jgi:hypothetical protein